MDKEKYIDIIMRQTSYTDREAEEKLEEQDGNYEEVIRSYYKKDVKTEIKKMDSSKSINQDIYLNIRQFMDKTKSSLKKR